MTDTEIRPALTPKQWATVGRGKEIRATETSYSLVSGDIAVYDDMGRVAEIDSDDRHMAAALCLYGQSFGFTAEDVAMLRDLASTIDAHSDGIGPEWVGEILGPLHLLTDRIAALLPTDQE